MDSIKLNQIPEIFTDFEYPVEKETLEEISKIRLVLADGEIEIGDILEDMPSRIYGSPRELEEEIYTYLPIQALGEPGQSEGDA